jgi:hypothetical protein
VAPVCRTSCASSPSASRTSAAVIGRSLGIRAPGAR